MRFDKIQELLLLFPPPWAKTVNIISPPKTGAAGSFFSFLGGGARYATLLGTPSAVTFRVCEQRREKRRCMLLSPETQNFFISVPPSLLPFSFFVPASPLLFDKKTHIRRETVQYRNL